MISKPDSCSGCPLYEPPYGKPIGFSYPSGSGKSGVMLVGEALGKDEEVEGMPFVGTSGFTLFQELKRIGIEREDFFISNTLRCRPPDNKLVKMPWEHAAIKHCASNLDRDIEQARAIALGAGKTFTIVTLGVTAFKRVMGIDSKRDAELLKNDYIGYPFWHDTYKAWVYAADHPAYLVRGNTHLWPVLQFVFQRALEVASNGLTLDNHDYLLDPSPAAFNAFITGFKASLVKTPDNPLSYDIETPYKKKKSEDDLIKDDESDHTILRISFSYVNTEGVIVTCSVKWSAEYMAGIEELFDIAPFVLGWNSDKYDYPRVSRYVKIKGISLDGMVAWHILNTSLPKGLGFVTPYYWQHTTMWKHLAEAQPAFYNAKDAEAALRNFIGIKKHLIEANLWHVYERHWIKLYEALKYMSGVGVLRDNEARDQAEAQLSEIMDRIETQMEDAVPKEARRFKVYKKLPKEAKPFLAEGLSAVEAATKLGLEPSPKDIEVKICEKCGTIKPPKSHFQSKKKKLCGQCGKNWSEKHLKKCVNGSLTLSPELNPCAGSTVLPSIQQSLVYLKPLEFKLSKLGLTNYQKALRHQAIKDRKENKTTFNEDAIVLLVKKYPRDPLYPLIIDYRKAGKLLGTYVGVKQPNGRLIGGMEVGPDGRIHTSFGRNASTLRFTSEDPNLQNLPRPNPSDPDDLANLIRNLIVAAPGNTLYARDFSGIEAVLTGYFALDPKYIRLAKRDVHTYYTVYAIYELEGGRRIAAADLPDLDWSDDRLFPYLEALKKRFKSERNSLYKHLVHAANFMQGAKGAQQKIFSETRVEYPVWQVQKVMDVYYNLFPSIKRWHKNVLDEAEKDGFLVNPFGYVHRFNRVYDYKMERGEWTKRAGPSANKVIAFKPQSTAVGIITEAILRLYFDRFDEAGQYLRLQIHDELFFECMKTYVEKLDAIAQEEMERPIPQMKMPASWGMGEYLSVLTEPKQGDRWGQMH